MWAYSNKEAFDLILPDWESAPSKEAAIRAVHGAFGSGWIAELEEVRIAPELDARRVSVALILLAMEAAKLPYQWQVRVMAQLPMNDLEDELRPLLKKVESKVAEFIRESYLPMYRILQTEQVLPNSYHAKEHK